MLTDRTPSLLPRRMLAAPLAFVLAACPGDDTTADTEATAGTSTGEPSTGPGLDTSDGAETSSSSTTAVADDTGTGTTTGETGDTSDSTGEPPPAGTCVGLDVTGSIASVLSRDGMPIDPTCDSTPAPCGGDVVGTWAIESSCGFEAFANPLEEACPGSTFTIEILSQTGTLTFEDDGSFVQDLALESQAVLTLDPMACFGSDCAGFEALLQMDTPDATCQAMGPSCTCTFPDDGASEQAMGTYAVDGTDLVLTTPDGTSAAPFCVAGDRFDLWQPIFGTPMPTDVECTSDEECASSIGDMYDFALCSFDDPPSGG